MLDVERFIRRGGTSANDLEEARQFAESETMESDEIQLIEEAGDIIEMWFQGRRFIIMTAEAFGDLADTPKD
jgi:hypothetical protein